MEELTNVVEEVTTQQEAEVNETGISVGTVATGVCAVTGILAITYGAYKGIKWVANKVKTKIHERDDIIDADYEEFVSESAVNED